MITALWRRWAALSPQECSHFYKTVNPFVTEACDLSIFLKPFSLGLQGMKRGRRTMSDASQVTQELVERAGEGDAAARLDLLERYREHLRRMVAARLDRRLAPRIDASDVVQETLAEAAGRLDDYLDRRPLPFLGWLRQLAGERVI
jgi:hypothetical protein